MLGWAPAVSIVSTISTSGNRANYKLRTNGSMAVIVGPQKMSRDNMQVLPLRLGTSNKLCIWKRPQHSGFNKKLLGRKRHAVVDSDGQTVLDRPRARRLFVCRR
jgi:hypothetical protein